MDVPPPPPTALVLPATLPYPVTLTHLAPPSSQVTRGDPLLSYAFVRDNERQAGRYLAPVTGVLGDWGVSVGEVLQGGREIGNVQEDCDHPVQIGGLCAVCGRDLTVTDYLSEGLGSAPPRPSLSISHSTPLLKVTPSEASRLHASHTRALEQQRRLSLIVDLDQTVVHATVDPTVGDWLEDLDKPEGERRLKGEEVRANLGEVGRFQLDERGGKSCWYYLKPRPGLAAFLTTLSAKYEMHVYTMGTRAYAEQVCRLIDPGGKFFGDRILSRDESGSLTQKSIARLFPVDDAMVVIIDDRSDVWSEARNLVKCVPYEFFVGTGDINGAFLPKQPAPASAPAASAAPSAASCTPTPVASLSSAPSTSTAPGSTVLSPPAEAVPLVTGPAATSAAAAVIAAEDPALVAKQEQAHARDIGDVLEERPLAAALERAMKDGAGAASSPSPAGSPAAERGGANAEDGEGRAQNAPKEEEEHGAVEKVDDAPQSFEWLFSDKDTELVRLDKILSEIHKRFYYAFDRASSAPRATRRPDVKEIIDRLKGKVLQDVVVVFSGVIPLGVRPESSEIWKLASAFGARCAHKIDGSVTHLIATKPGTEKVYQASSDRYRQRVAIVRPSWIAESCAVWDRLPEEPYMLELERTNSPPPAPAAADAGKAASGEPNGEKAEEAVGGEAKELEIDWGQADRELEEFLEGESEDDESLFGSELAGGGEGEGATDGLDGAGGLEGTLESAGSSTAIDTKSKKRPRPSSLPPSDHLLPSSASQPPAAGSTTPPHSPKRSRLRTSHTPSPSKSILSLPPSPSSSGRAKRTARTVSFDDAASVRSTSSFGTGQGGTDDSDDDEELDEWTRELEGSLQAGGASGGDGG